MRKPILASLVVLSAFGILEVTKERPTELVPTVVKTIRIQPEEVKQETPPTVPEEQLRASWYHEGKRVATGARYNPNGITCAHRTLPFGTIVRVTNLENNKSVDCKINDRGPAKWTGKDIDLSRGSAKKIMDLKKGHIPVKLEIINNG